MEGVTDADAAGEPAGAAVEGAEGVVLGAEAT
jgi:hypothetical protein